MNAFVIDAFEFCRVRERRDGEIVVAELPRLAKESIDRDGALRWSLQGGVDNRGNPQLSLAIVGTVGLMCQRCLTPFVFDIRSDALLVLANDEGSADALDALLADEPVEVIVGSRELSIAELIEDEALLAVPLSPRHVVCPSEAMPSSFSEKEEKISPFAVLKKLKE